jgi:hypothetical protein
MSSKRKSGATPADPNLDTMPDDGPVKPQIIDATAEVLPGDAPMQSEPENRPRESAESAYVPPPSSARKGRSWTLPLAALIAGALGGGWLYRDVIASYFPSDQVSALQARNAELQASISQLTSESGALKSAVNDIATGLQTGQQSSETLTASQKSSDARIARLGNDMVAITKRIDQLQTDMASSATAVVPGSPDASALKNLVDRVTRLEAELANLQTAKTTASADMTNVAALNKRASAGESFAAELATVSHLIVPDETSLLEQAASSGLDSASSLIAALPSLAPAGTAASTQVAEERSWYENMLSDFITITPIGERDWKSILVRAEDEGKTGGLSAAIANLDAAEKDGALPANISAWRDKARQRVALDAVLQRMSARAMQASGG